MHILPHPQVDETSAQQCRVQSLQKRIETVSFLTMGTSPFIYPVSQGLEPRVVSVGDVPAPATPITLCIGFVEDVHLDLGLF